MQEAGEKPPPMPFNPAPHITDWLLEIGPDKGDTALEWVDLKAWQDLTGIELLPFEATFIRNLSIVYCNQKHEATKRDCPMPHNLARDEIEARRDVVAAKLAALFG